MVGHLPDSSGTTSAAASDSGAVAIVNSIPSRATECMAMEPTDFVDYLSHSLYWFNGFFGRRLLFSSHLITSEAPLECRDGPLLCRPELGLIQCDNGSRLG